MFRPLTINHRPAPALVGVVLFFCLLLAKTNSQNVPALRVPQQPVISTAKSNAPAQSISSSKQFVIHGADLHTRGSFALLSEEVSSALGQLLHDDARYAVPVVIDLHTPPEIAMTGPTVSIDMSVVENSIFHFGLIVQLRADFRTDDFTRELVRVLLVERILRDHPQVLTTRRPILPDWLATGVTQAMDFRARSRPSAVFAAVFRSGQFYSVEKIFTLNPTTLDSLSRSIFDTSSCALVLALLDQQEGPLRFAKFLSALATDSKSDRELLLQSFPKFSTSKNSLEKWWTLQMATLSTPSALESMTIEETESKLDAALTLEFTETPDEAAKAVKKSSGIFGMFSSGKTKAPDKNIAPDTTVPNEDTKPKNNRFMWIFPGGKQKEKPDGDVADIPAQPTSNKAKTPKESDKKEKLPKAEPTTTNKNDKPDGKHFPWLFSIGKPKDKPDGDTTVSPLKSDPKKTDKLKEPDKKQKPEDTEKKLDVPEPATITLFGGRKVVMPLRADESNELEDTPTLAQADTEKKPSLLNPMNWFNKSGKKTDADETKKPAKVDLILPAKPERPKPPDNTPVPVTATLDDFARVMSRKDRAEIFKPNITRLNALKLRAHPLYKSLIGDYTEQVQNLIAGKDKGATDKLDALRKRRAQIHELARAVESHLDWFEATQTKTRSGLFDDYLKLRDKLEKEARPRTDAISKYLDSLAKEYD